MTRAQTLAVITAIMIAGKYGGSSFETVLILADHLLSCVEAYEKKKEGEK